MKTLSSRDSEAESDDQGITVEDVKRVFGEARGFFGLANDSELTFLCIGLLSGLGVYDFKIVEAGMFFRTIELQVQFDEYSDWASFTIVC